MDKMGFTKEQESLLEDFANASDVLFELGVISTDSFTGEIGEYVACQFFHLKKAARVTKAIDGICPNGYKYQVKAKIVSSSTFSYNITNLSPQDFDFLTVVYFDRNYNILKIIRVPSHKIKGTTFHVTNTVLTDYEFNIKDFHLSKKIQSAIYHFAQIYNLLEEKKIIKSRKIVGDIGEFYACKVLNLSLCSNQNTKGYDATNQKGLKFEIKTRRVYESGRRDSKTRRINNLAGKDADYLIVVTIDRSFRCYRM